MTGRVQKTIAAIYDANPTARFTVRQLASLVYPDSIIDKKHTDSVTRALSSNAKKLGLHKCRVGSSDRFGWHHVWGRLISSVPVHMAAIETRSDARTETRDIEARFTTPTDDGTIEGVAVRFDVVDSYRTTFAPEAFRGLEGRTLPMLWSHDPAQVIGSWTGFEARDGGLVARGKLNLAVSKAQEVRALLQAGDIRGLSIGFKTLKDERQSSGVRRITDAQLFEISVVTFASVPGSGITSIRAVAHDVNAFITATRAATATLKG